MTAYVALGDSYAAGVGGGDRVDTCWRADRGYPVQVARATRTPTAYAACIGATVDDVRAVQLDALDEATRWVTLTVGGNDVGFTPVLVAAAEPAWLNDSRDDIERALRTLREDLPGSLRGLYAEVRDRAPDATVVVTGYPRLFSSEDCQLATFFTGTEIAMLNDAAVELSGVVRTEAEAAGFGFVDVLDAFVGHAICADEEWVHGVSLPLAQSFHPRPAGHDAYSRAVLAGLRLEAAEEGDPPVVTRVPSRGSAPVFRLPRLRSARSREEAARWGLDADRMADLARTVEPMTPSTPAQEQEAADELHAMHRAVLERRGIPS
ncbi:hypothetical protein LUZ63_020319 [Rhynchospora breviuscula]|uniref:SGNH hydrolase-type esterase domain-containing protein n=1 Tax=Rhynchospora breviuscula TaxID=2022672 RepID=A0A9P9Z911_9POAL|nr:hypothetical protein LUZ63_020319 [Rhynchospora breviuscula]